ncbi:hypothetical protein [Cytobacillus sp. IB215665]|uniref:hypothetical protein n=1 Tax=Cytobacillus sp. IB215665 TaxID=3097357 RepID=UPI002A0BBBF3|nr:hypothetical protein [Cytobacillus sp. IB215665]MDX8364899.1 hypothetical protein [Cytobacillus sp. IB215665]
MTERSEQIMKRLSTFLLLSFIFIASCQQNDTSSIQINKDDLQLMFFSDENNVQNEINYYDALLELKKEFPHEISNMVIISSQAEEVNISINQYPALVMMYDNEIIAQVEGHISKDEIMNPIKEALEGNKE